MGLAWAGESQGGFLEEVASDWDLVGETGRDGQRALRAPEPAAQSLSVQSCR